MLSPPLVGGPEHRRALLLATLGHRLLHASELDPALELAHVPASRRKQIEGEKKELRFCARPDRTLLDRRPIRSCLAEEMVTHLVVAGQGPGPLFPPRQRQLRIVQLETASLRKHQQSFVWALDSSQPVPNPHLAQPGENRFQSAGLVVIAGLAGSETHLIVWKGAQVATPQPVAPEAQRAAGVRQVAAGIALSPLGLRSSQVIEKLDAEGIVEQERR